MNIRVYITIVLLFLSSLGIYAQNTEKRISVSFTDIPLSQAISKFEKSSGYTFFYDSKNTNLKQKVSLAANNTPVADAVRSMLKTTDLDFEITNTQIALFVKGKQSTKQSKATIDIKGSVVDAKGEPVIGATVVQLGTTNGTMTDVEGKFILSAPADSKIQTSYLGYISQTVNASSNLSVTLKEDNHLLDEVVVVGYGTQKKENLIGAVSLVTSDDLKNRPVTSVGQALQGQVPNLNITFGSGMPGSDTGLNIRGVNTIGSNSNAKPLVLVDGVESSIDMINPNDIESISVLKDAASAAIYGARAGFGVILITTKSNKDGKATISYRGRFSTSSATRKTDFITSGYDAATMINNFQKAFDGTEYVRYDASDMEELMKRRNDSSEDPNRPWVVEKNGKYMYYANFDWYNYLFDYSQPTWNHDVSINGGTEKFNYLVSGSHLNKDGIYALNTDKYKTYNLNVRLTAQVNPWLKITAGTKLFKSDYKSPGYDFEDGGNIPNYTFHALPFLTPYNPDGSSVFTTQLTPSAPADGLVALTAQGNAYSQAKKTQTISTVSGVATILPGLDITGSFSYRRYNKEKQYRSANITYSQIPGVIETNKNGFFSDKLRDGNDIEEHYTYDLYGTFERKIKDHNFKLLAGMNHELFYYKRLYGAKAALQSNSLNDLNLGTGAQESRGGQRRWQTLGFFSRLSYDYQGKYLAEVNMRWDGTSRFSSDDRWGYFPSVALGWRVSEEAFFAPMRSTVDNLKLRASIGSLGNQVVNSEYPYIQTLGLKSSNGYIMDGNRIYINELGAAQSGSLTWEKIISKNFGIDLGLLKNRLTATADLYVRDTKDMLIPGKELPAVYGMQAPNQNAGDLRTSGYELTIGWQDKLTVANKPFNYSIALSLADSKSKITRFDNPTNSLSSYIEGREIGEIWGYRVKGMFKSDEEASKHPIDQTQVNGNLHLGMQAGDLIFEDINGDGKINNGKNTLEDSGDRVVIGNNRPRYHYSANLGASWNGIDFSMFFQGIGKQNVYPGQNNMLFWGPYARPYSSFIPKTFQTDVWTPDNQDAYFPKARAYAAQGNRPLAQVNDRYLQNMAYCRLKNLTFGYTLPNELASKLRINRLRLYFSGDNLLTFTKLKSDYIDPEQMTSDLNGRVYPFSKTYSFGIDITF